MKRVIKFCITLLIIATFISCSNDEDVVIKAELTTSAVTSITQTGGASGGNISSNGGGDITARGVVWSTSQNPTINDNLTVDGTGTGNFTSSLSNLSRGTKYFVRAYATNSAGTAYGNEVNFTTDNIELATVTTTDVIEITQTTAISGGNVTSDGGGSVTARGVVWGISQNPTINDNLTVDGTGTGSFTSDLSSLNPATTYFVRAYATNNTGTVYGNEVSFTTDDIQSAIVTTIDVTEITQTTAMAGGDITSDGGSEVTARGVVWSTLQNPTINDNLTEEGSGSGNFTSNLSGLSTATTYFVRAYATNSAGTAYGDEVSFTTATEDGAVINPETGRIWMDRNLGASRVATSKDDPAARGDLYQWGRDTDGHEKRTSATTTTLSSSDTPGHGDFIVSPNTAPDWRSPQNDNLWQEADGINNPCPTGYRVPTQAEFEAERQSWSADNAFGAFSSPLKLSIAGTRGINGNISGTLIRGVYWTSTISGAASISIVFTDFVADIDTNFPSARGAGLSVRCIKD